MDQTDQANPIYKRIILKITGEALGGDNKVFNTNSARFIAREIRSVLDLGVKIGIVMGGGNVIRGAELQKEGVEKNVADWIGMLATAQNALLLEFALEELGIEARAMTALEMKELAEPYIIKKANKYLSEGRVVIVACGIGNPGFSTDTAAFLCAQELKAEAVLKGTKVRGIFNDDPLKNPGAEFIPELSYDDAVARKLKIMDSAAIVWARDNYPTPIRVFNIFEEGNLECAILGGKVGSVIRG